jgi:hypothetical protein
VGNNVNQEMLAAGRWRLESIKDVKHVNGMRRLKVELKGVTKNNKPGYGMYNIIT